MFLVHILVQSLLTKDVSNLEDLQCSSTEYPQLIDSVTVSTSQVKFTNC